MSKKGFSDIDYIDDEDEAIDVLEKQYDDYERYCFITGNKVIPINDYVVILFHNEVYNENK